MKGITARIIRGQYGDCSNGGISSEHDRVTIVAGIEKVLGKPAVVAELPEEAQRVEATDDAPAVALVFRSGGSLGALPVCAVPVEVVEDGAVTEARGGVGPMMGGARIVAELDSEQAFGLLTGGVLSADLHDRFETAAQYASYD